MNRRQFLSLAGGVTGYSLCVSLDGFAAGASLPSHEEIAEGFDRIAPPDPSERPLPSEPNMTLVDLPCDILVAGGGMAGVCAAVAAARHGAKVVLVQDRSRLGGNASSEVKMHIVGANNHGGRPGWREGGLIEEFRLDDAVNNPHRSWELWDLLLYDKVKSEPNITLLLDTALFAVEKKDGLIRRAMARCDKTEHLYRISAPLYLDCTGDSRLAVEAGASYRWGRETRREFNEPLALEKPDRKTLGSSILFTARDYGQPIPYSPPKWARHVTKKQLRFRGISSWEYGYWWIEWGGNIDTIRDNERIRFELLSIVTGVWNYIKNSGEHPSSANWGMDWVGMIPGKRESRRIVGEHILTQPDLLGLNGDLEDAVAIGGWPLDDHPPGGFDDYEKRPFVSIKLADVYNIPLRSLCCKDVPNLMMAGRNISASHVAFTSTRVMATCSVVGQAAGTAAAYCLEHQVLPGQLCANRQAVLELQQRLLRDDQTIKNRKNIDPKDLARSAKVTASDEFAPSKAVHVINGLVRDVPGQWNNRWGALLSGERPWLELAWDQPRTLRQIQITFDSGFHRELTLTSSDAANARMIRAPQPETVRDYELLYSTGEGQPFQSLVKVTGNYQRLNRHSFAPIQARAVRLRITATNGSDTARVFEVRCYG